MTPPVTRRNFLRIAGTACAAASLGFPGRLCVRNHELLIQKIRVQQAKGQRLSPVAPNAYAPYRGYEVVEPVLRIQTAQGLEGICRYPENVMPESLRKLIGLDPFELFEFD